MVVEKFKTSSIQDLEENFLTTAAIYAYFSFSLSKKIHLFEATSILNNAKLNLNIFFKKSLLALIMYVCFVSTWVKNTLSFKNKYICLSRLVRNFFLQEKHSKYMLSGIEIEIIITLTQTTIMLLSSNTNYRLIFVMFAL